MHRWHVPKKTIPAPGPGRRVGIGGLVLACPHLAVPRGPRVGVASPPLGRPHLLPSAVAAAAAAAAGTHERHAFSRSGGASNHGIDSSLSSAGNLAPSRDLSTWIGSERLSRIRDG